MEFGLLNRVWSGKTGPSLETGLSQPHSLLSPLLLAPSCGSVMQPDWGTQDTQRKWEMCLDSRWFTVAGSWTEVFWISILKSGTFIPPCSHSGHSILLWAWAQGCVSAQHHGTACLTGIWGAKESWNWDTSLTGLCEHLKYIDFIFWRVRSSFQRVLGNLCLSQNLVWPPPSFTLPSCICWLVWYQAPPVLLSLLKIMAVWFFYASNNRSFKIRKYLLQKHKVFFVLQRLLYKATTDQGPKCL